MGEQRLDGLYHLALHRDMLPTTEDVMDRFILKLRRLNRRRLNPLCTYFRITITLQALYVSLLILATSSTLCLESFLPI